MCVCADAAVRGVQERQGDAAVDCWLRQRGVVPRTCLLTVGLGRSRDPAGARHQPPAADFWRPRRRRDVYLQGCHVIQHRCYTTNVTAKQVIVALVST